MTRSLSIVLICLALVTLLVACQSGGAGSWFPFLERGEVPNPPPQDKTLSAMAWWAFIPGVLMLAASFWLPILRNWGATFLAVGIGIGVLSALVNDYSHWITLAAFGAIAIWAIAWHGPEVLNKWRTRKHDCRSELERRGLLTSLSLSSESGSLSAASSGTFRANTND